jgi:glycosyltransferase involved in cell wall biosynthesis
MRVLIAHNRYQQRGGEDQVVATESALLRSNGHTVTSLDVDNDHIQSPLSRISASFGSIYSRPGRQLMRDAIDRVRPDIVHVHNFFPTLSPSVFQACSQAAVPVVHTLHNFRILCANATLFRDGHTCEDCISARSFLPAVQHACYRSSHLGSAVAGFTMAVHDNLGTWSSKVSAYIALSEFSASKLGSFRIPHKKIFVKPNSAEDRGLGDTDGNYAIFAGRLTQEKGIQTLIDADAAGLLCIDVAIAGDGPMRDRLQRAAARPNSRLLYKGILQHHQLLELMRHARALIMPSLWYEGGLPLVVIEAFSLGLPVIGANLGNVAAAISHGETGLLYTPGDHKALSFALAQLTHDTAAERRMRSAARAHYLASYTPEKNYQRLIEIYEDAIQRPAAQESLSEEP